MGSHRYPAAYVERLSDAEGRRLLEMTGLPDVPGVFEPAESSSGPAGETLVIGKIWDEGVYYLGAADGQITYFSHFTSAESHVNASVHAFAETLRLFREVTDHLPADSDSSQFVSAADSLEAAFETIDPTALRDPIGFWRSLLADVANGDYTDEDE